MSHASYMNPEIIMIQKIEENISKMYQSNYKDDGGVPDYFKENLENNYKYGYTSVVFMITLIESSLNDIINQTIETEKEGFSRVDTMEKLNNFLRLDIKRKIQEIYKFYNINISNIHNSKEYENIINVLRVRNSFIHFDGKKISETVYDLGFKLSNISLDEYFVKDNMEKVYALVISLLQMITRDLSFNVDFDVDILVSGSNSSFLNNGIIEWFKD